MNLKKKKLFLLDMDGTIYLGDRLFKGAREFLKYIKASGARYMFLTNNSSKGVSEYIDKLKRMDIEAEEKDFMTSLQATIHYLINSNKNRIIYALGTDGMRNELCKNGLDARERPDAQTNCIVVGFDTQLTFNKIENACRVIEGGAEYIATHPDLMCPLDGVNVPDCGALCEMLYMATGRRPKVIGKPEPLMAQMAMEKAGIGVEESVFIGDRLNTDIACGINAGMDTVLVLTGATNRRQAQENAIQASLVCDNIYELYCLLKA